MKKNVIRLLFALVALLTSTSMLAENKLWIEQYGVADDGYEFAIMLENDANLAALQFNLTVPNELIVIGESNNQIYPNDARLNVSQMFDYRENNSNNFTCAVFATRNDSFVGSNGPLAFFKVKGRSSSIDFSQPLGITLENIIYSSYSGNKLEGESEWNGEVAINAVINVYSSYTEKIVNPATTFDLPIEFSNSEDVQGLQFDMMLPDGFTLGDDFVFTDRISDGSGVNVTKAEDANIYRLILWDPKGAYAVRNKGEGLIFTCQIIAPETIAEGTDLNIVIANVLASAGSSSYPGSGSTIKLINGNEAYTKANAEITALQTALDAALETIATDCPDVKDRFTGEEIQTAINNLKEAADAAYADLTLTENYDEVMAPAAGIKESIDKLVEDAKAAQAAEADRKANNQAKYDEAIAAIEELQTNLNNAVTVIESDYAEYKDEEAIAAVQAKIDEAKAEADAAYEAVAAEGEFSYEVDKAGITTDIEGLVLAAEAAKAAAEAEADRQKKNEEAYNAVLDEIKAIQEHFDATVKTIGEEYAEYEDKEAEGKVQGAINDAAVLAKESYEAVAEAGEFEYTVDADALNSAIDALLAAAKAAKDKAEGDAEAARQAENKAAYEADLASLEGLYSLYRQNVNTIQENYAEYENVSAELAVRNYLDDVKAGIERAYKAVEKEGTYSYELDWDALKASIEKLLTDAQQAAADAEAARVARNEAAYNAVMDQIEQLKNEADEAVKKIETEYPDYNATSRIREIDAAIVAAENAANAAKEAVSEEGEFDFTFDPELIRALINEMLQEAEITGVEAIEAEVVAGNAYIFTLDGKQHQRPVQGEVNVIVRKNGETSKIFVK